MYNFLEISFTVVVIVYLALQFLHHGTQNRKEPCLTQTTIPFLDPLIGILRHRVNYLAGLRYARYHVQYMKRHLLTG